MLAGTVGIENRGSEERKVTIEAAVVAAAIVPTVAERPMRWSIVGWGMLALVASAALPPWVRDVQRAMRDELQRSMDSLSIESLSRPYYIEYTLRYRWTARAKATLGGILDSSYSPAARLTVGVRVGSPQRDNTNFFDAASLFFGGLDDEESYRNRPVQRELSYALLRRELWLATDAAYKAAVEQFAKKEAVLKNRVQQDTTPDFILLPPEEAADTSGPIPRIKLSEIVERLKQLSSLARNYPAVQTATVTFEHVPELIIYVNSEGRSFIKIHRQAGIEVVATAQAADGMPLAQTYAAYAPTVAALPSWDSVARAVHRILERLSSLCTAPAATEPYSGPVLFSGQAAAELFAQVFAPNLVAQRTQVTEQGVQEQDRFGVFQNKLGARVMAEFLSVESVPHRHMIESTPVAGAYLIDDEGIKPQPLVLVRRGYLEQLLSSRVPTRRIRYSNGRARGGGAMYDVLLLRCEDRRRSATESQLLEKMQQILRRRDLPYGYIVRGLLNQNLLYTAVYQQTSGTYPSGRDGQIPALLVERVWRDGRKELVRGMMVAAGGYQVFRDVVAVGTNLHVHNFLAPSVISPYRTGGAHYLIATVAVPDLLIEDIELRPIDDGFPKPPLLSSPMEVGQPSR